MRLIFRLYYFNSGDQDKGGKNRGCNNFITVMINQRY